MSSSMWEALYTEERVLNTDMRFHLQYFHNVINSTPLGSATASPASAYCAPNFQKLENLDSSTHQIFLLFNMLLKNFDI